MAIYSIKGVDEGERVVDVAAADTAKLAVTKFIDALEQYRRAWVSDQTGADVSMDDLVQLAISEERSLQRSAH